MGMSLGLTGMSLTGGQGVPGPVIVFDRDALDENVATGTPWGTLSVANSTDPWTFAIVTDADGVNTLDVDGVTVKTADTLNYTDAPTHSVKFSATNDNTSEVIYGTFTEHVNDLAAPAMTSAASFDVVEGFTSIGTLTTSRAATVAIGGADAASVGLTGSGTSFPLTFDSAAVVGDYALTATPTGVYDGDVGMAQSIAVHVLAAPGDGSPAALGIGDWTLVATNIPGDLLATLDPASLDLNGGTLQGFYYVLDTDDPVFFAATSTPVELLLQNLSPTDSDHDVYLLTKTNLGVSEASDTKSETPDGSGGAAVPVNSVAPVISGTVAVGNSLSTTDGTWSNSPTGYTYQWQRNGSDISGATSNTYPLAVADAGQDITCDVIASNGSGSGSAATSNSLTIDVYVVQTAHIVDPANASTYSGGVWDSVSFGTAAANRRIVVGVAANGALSGLTSVSSVSVAGNAATSAKAAVATNNGTAYILVQGFIIADAVNTSGNISVALAAAAQRAGAGVWAIYGAASGTPDASSPSTTTNGGTMAVTIAAQGAAIAWETAGGVTSPAVAWAGVNEDYDQVIEGNSSHSGGSLNSHAGGAVNVSGTVSGGTVAVYAAQTLTWSP